MFLILFVINCMIRTQQGLGACAGAICGYSQHIILENFAWEAMAIRDILTFTEIEKNNS